MNRTSNRILAGVASSFLALALLAAPVRAGSPRTEIGLAGHDFVLNPLNGLWLGTVTLTVDGVEYEGSGVWWITDLAVVNKNSIHYFAAAIYDFGDLGSFEVWEHGNMDWGIVEPGYRLSPFLGVERIVDGAGAFADTHGVLHYDWGELEVIGDGLPVVNFDMSGWVNGLEIDD